MSSSFLAQVRQLEVAPIWEQAKVIPWSQLALKVSGLVVLAFLVNLIATGIYRAYFDELSHIPGPRLAAATKLWWVYYNVYPHNGKLCFLLPELHKKYGPVIRISPTEVTIKDMESYHEVHKFGSQFFKDPLTYAQPFINFLANGCLNNTIDHQTARHRRQAFAPYLRPQAIRNNDVIVHQHLNALTERLRDWDPAKPLNIQLAYRCMAGDIVSAVTYNGRLNFLEDEEFEPEYLKVAGSSSRLVGLIVSFRFLGDMMLFLVKTIPKKYSPPAFKFLTQFRGMIAKDVDALRESQEKISLSNPKMGGINGESVFYRVIKDPQYHIPEHALISDALVFLAAGMDTTAHTLTLMTYHLLQNPDVYDKLMQEIEAHLPEIYDEATSSSLLQLPYLSATIKEALRMSTGVPNGMRRIVPSEGHIVDGKQLPPGTVIIHPNYVSHFDEEVFPEPNRFKPERWIEATPEQYKEMDRNSNPFLRGARACLGIHLAYSELHMATAHLFRRFKFSFVDAAEAEDNILNWVDQNLPQFKGPLRLYVEPRNE